MGIPLNIDWQQILLHLFNFTILFAILYFLLYSPVKQFMDKRQAYYKELDDNANESLKNADALKAEYEEKLNGVLDEIAAMKEKAQHDAEAAAHITVEKSKIEAERMISDAKVSVERERKKMLSEARNEISDIITQAVKKVVVNDDTTTSYDTFLDAVERGDADA